MHWLLSIHFHSFLSSFLSRLIRAATDFLTSICLGTNDGALTAHKLNMIPSRTEIIFRSLCAYSWISRRYLSFRNASKCTQRPALSSPRDFSVIKWRKAKAQATGGSRSREKVAVVGHRVHVSSMSKKHLCICLLY